MVEFILNLIISALFFILVAGVIYVVIEFFKQFIDKKALEKEIEKLNRNYTEFHNEISEKLTQYSTSVDRINKNWIDAQNNFLTDMKSSESDVERIIEISQSLIDLNENLFYRISLIQKSLDGNTLSPNTLNDIESMLTLDIEKKRAFESQIANLVSEREQRIQERMLIQKKHDIDLEL